MEIDADDLWAVEPGSFVAERDALAKRLRAAGDKAAATEVKARRRPPVSAWALNVLARDEPDVVTDALDAGAALEAALQGGAGAREERAEAQQAERRATDQLIVAAGARIEGTGQQVTEAIKGRMVQTIRAAQLDPDVAARLRAGTLADDETPSMFGLALGADAGAAIDRPARSAAPARQARIPTRGRATAPTADREHADREHADEPAAAPTSTTPAPNAPAPSPARPKVDKAAEKAAREQARAARVALAHQQDETRRLAKRADRLEERAAELATEAEAAADAARAARAESDRAAAALAEAEARAETGPAADA